MYSGSCHVNFPFAYGAFTLSGWLSQNHSAKLVRSITRSEPRNARIPVWALPFSLAATHRITCCFLFLRLLRCFSSPGSPPYVMDWRMDTWGVLMWVSPFRDLRVNGYLLLTAAYRSLSRLSSALSAKASTLRSSSLDRVVIRSTLFGSCEQQPHHVSRLLLFRKNGIFAGHDNTGLYDCVSFSISSLRW